MTRIDPLDIRLRLPPTVVLRDEVTVEGTPTGLRLTLRGRSLIVKAALDDAAAFQRLSDRANLATRCLNRAVVRALEALGSRGFLRDAETDTSSIGGLTLVAWCVDEVERLSAEILEPGDSIRRLVQGGWTTTAVRAWFVENFHFTDSAVYRIEPARHYTSNCVHQANWRAFLEQEASHWRIYRPALGFYGTDVEAVRKSPALTATIGVIRAFRDAAESSEYSHALALMWAEEAPSANSLQDDALFSGFTTHYGVPEVVLRPLWWHATENLRAGHTYMPAALISSLPRIDHSSLSAMRAHLVSVMEASVRWYDEMEQA